jgi:hypothetical protein
MHAGTLQMRAVAAVTTFNRDGYEQYGRRMIESFERYWPRDLILYCYAEGFKPDVPSRRIVVVDLLAACPELVAFKQRHRDNERAHGIQPHGTRVRVYVKRRKTTRLPIPRVKLVRMERGIGYRWNAVRFSHKSFAVFDASVRCKADILCWLDGDIVVFDEIPRAFLEGLVPPDHLLGYLKRPKFSECGFIAYNLRHPSISDFFKKFKALYTTDRLFREQEYHDSWLFDVVRKHFERRNCKTFDIAGGKGAYAGHVFINSPLGKYMDHMKGGRWALGSSSPEDLVAPRHEPYWARLTPVSGENRAPADAEHAERELIRQ